MFSNTSFLLSSDFNSSFQRSFYNSIWTIGVLNSQSDLTNTLYQVSCHDKGLLMQMFLYLPEPLQESLQQCPLQVTAKEIAPQYGKYPPQSNVPTTTNIPSVARD